MNKESHADRIRETVTQYFLAQRIKLPDESDSAAVEATATSSRGCTSCWSTP